MNHDEWRERFKHRNDISTRITHLTNGDTSDEAFENLLSILQNKKIKGGLGYISGDIKAVCLQEAPLNSIAENLMYEKALREKNDIKRHRYRAFGLRFSKVFIYRKGGRPVIYGNASEMKQILPKCEYWRIVDLELDRLNYLVDWTHEREWRIKGDLEFQYSNTEIIVPSNKYYRRFVTYCEENKSMDILKNINGIVTLNSINY